MRMSFPRAGGRQGAAIVFPAMAALRRVKLSKNNVPKMRRVTGVRLQGVCVQCLFLCTPGPAPPLSGANRAPKGRPTRTPPRNPCVCRVFIFKDTGVQPHLSVGLTSVRQKGYNKGGLPGPGPPRDPRSRIPRCVCVECLFLRTPGSSPTSQWG